MRQQRIQSPMKARKLKVPPSTTARNIGWFWFNPLDKTERERREGRYLAGDIALVEGGLGFHSKHC